MAALVTTPGHAQPATAPLLSARCVRRFNDSRVRGILVYARIIACRFLLRSSSIREPRHPSLGFLRSNLVGSPAMRLTASLSSRVSTLTYARALGSI
eukprot:12008060-Prorocentrum_lima.AAC.3